MAHFEFDGALRAIDRGNFFQDFRRYLSAFALDCVLPCETLPI